MNRGGTLYYLAGDHLGSASMTYSSNSAYFAAKRCYPWGEERYTYGRTPTTFR
jgi:hypothetical protein